MMNLYKEIEDLETFENWFYASADLVSLYHRDEGIRSFYSYLKDLPEQDYHKIKDRLKRFFKNRI